MKNKNHGNGQKHDEDEFIRLFMLAMFALTIIAIVIQVATWFVK